MPQPMIFTPSDISRAYASINIMAEIIGFLRPPPVNHEAYKRAQNHGCFYNVTGIGVMSAKFSLSPHTYAAVEA